MVFLKLRTHRALFDAIAPLKCCRSFSNKGPKPYKVSPDRAGENRAARLELAAAYRGLNYLGLNEGVCNHLSLMAPRADAEGDLMLVFPFTLHWSEVTASNIVGIDRSANLVEGINEPDIAASCIHLGIRRIRPDCKVIMHTHQPYATAIACMRDPTLQMIHQNSARFYGKISYEPHFEGLALAMQEGERLGKSLGNGDVMLMKNHGVIVTAPTVALAFERVYYLERAAQLQIYAESLQRPIALLSDEEAKLTYKQFEKYAHKYADAYFYAIYRLLQRIQPDFEN